MIEEPGCTLEQPLQPAQAAERSAATGYSACNGQTSDIYDQLPAAVQRGIIAGRNLSVERTGAHCFSVDK